MRHARLVDRQTCAPEKGIGKQYFFIYMRITINTIVVLNKQSFFNRRMRSLPKEALVYAVRKILPFARFRPCSGARHGGGHARGTVTVVKQATHIDETRDEEYGALFKRFVALKERTVKVIRIIGWMSAFSCLLDVLI